MDTLVNTQPSAIVTEFGSTLFYFDAHPKKTHRLPPQSEFDVVYSPSDVQGWEVVRYRVPQNRKGFFVVDRHQLKTDEIDYFERLMENAWAQA
jgi:hypothetical protein